MTKDEIKKIIIEEILNVAPDIEEGNIAPDVNIQRTYEIDSFDSLRILTSLSKRVGVEVPEADYSKVDTLNNMAEYFLERL